MLAWVETCRQEVTGTGCLDGLLLFVGASPPLRLQRRGRSRETLLMRDACRHSTSSPADGRHACLVTGHRVLFRSLDLVHVTSVVLAVVLSPFSSRFLLCLADASLCLPLSPLSLSLRHEVALVRMRQILLENWL